MKVLIALPLEHKSYHSLDDIISGQAPVNGTDGSMIRLAGLLTKSGNQEPRRKRAGYGKRFAPEFQIRIAI